MDAKDLQTSDGIGNADVDLTIETAEPTKGGIDGVGSVGCSHHDDMGTLFETVHQGEQLRDNTAFDLTVRLLTFGRDGIELVDEDDRWCVLKGWYRARVSSGSCLRTFSASSKAFRKFDSDSPANFDMISGPLIRKKKAPVSFATARAISVLPRIHPSILIQLEW